MVDVILKVLDQILVGIIRYDNLDVNLAQSTILKDDVIDLSGSQRSTHNTG